MKLSSIVRTAAALGAAALLVACAKPTTPGAGGETEPIPSTSSGASSAAPTSSVASSSIPAGVYQSRKVTGKKLVAGTTVSLVLDGTRIGANAGCNQMGGTATITAGTLITEDLASTLMGCQPDLAEQDAWIGALLTKSSWVLAGTTLTLSNHAVTVEFERTGPVIQGSTIPTAAAEPATTVSPAPSSSASPPVASPTPPVASPASVTDAPPVTPISERSGAPGKSIPEPMPSDYGTR